jgi:hypothetical protein
MTLFAEHCIDRLHTIPATLPEWLAPEALSAITPVAS